MYKSDTCKDARSVSLPGRRISENRMSSLLAYRIFVDKSVNKAVNKSVTLYLVLVIVRLHVHGLETITYM